jgi:hypothetical protein
VSEMSRERQVLYCDSLAKKNSEALSFIPRPMLERYADSGQILMAFENGEPCGFLIFGNGWPILRVYQACIQYDARRRASGRQLIHRLVNIADRRQCGAISLWCASDLDSNSFWRECGFSLTGTRQGGVRRGRIHNHWHLQIAPHLFASAPLPAASGEHQTPTDTGERSDGI